MTDLTAMEVSQLSFELGKLEGVAVYVDMKGMQASAALMNESIHKICEILKLPHIQIDYSEDENETKEPKEN